MPVVQLDEDTIRNVGIELDDDPFAGVEGVRKLKSGVKKRKAWFVENGVDDGVTVDGHGRGYDEVESVSSHRHHRQREPGGGVPSCSEDVKRARKEAGRLEREREGKKEREKERISDAGTDAT